MKMKVRRKLYDLTQNILMFSFFFEEISLLIMKLLTLNKRSSGPVYFFQANNINNATKATSTTKTEIYF